MAGGGAVEGVGDGGGEVGGVVDAGDAFAAGAVHGLDDDGPVEVVNVLEGIVGLAVTAGVGHVEAVVGQKLAETRLVLQDAGGLIAALEREAHFLGSIGGCHDTWIHGKGHDAVNLQFLGQLEHGLLVDNAYVVVLIAVLVGDVAGQVVHGNHMDAVAVGCLDDGQQVAQPAQEHEFLFGFFSHIT